MLSKQGSQVSYYKTWTNISYQGQYQWVVSILHLNFQYRPTLFYIIPWNHLFQTHLWQICVLITGVSVIQGWIYIIKYSWGTCNTGESSFQGVLNRGVSLYYYFNPKITNEYWNICVSCLMNRNTCTIHTEISCLGYIIDYIDICTRLYTIHYNLKTFEITTTTHNIIYKDICDFK